MQKIRSMALALASTGALLMGSQQGVMADLAVPEQAPKSEKLAAAVEFQMFELDGKVEDIIWCGEANDVMLVKSADGSIYRSRDRGGNWKRLKGMMNKQGAEVADTNQEIGEVHRMTQNPVDDSLVVFVGTRGINWVTEDCGATTKAYNAGKKIHEFMYHPLQRSWALAASWTSCAEFQDEPCKIYKELYYTKNLGEEWTYITNYVFDFEWGSSAHAKEHGVKIPDERVFLTKDPNSSGHQSASKKGTWSTQINLYASDDFYVHDNRLMVESGNTLVKTPQYMFVACSHSDEKRVQIYSSNYRTGFLNPRKVRLPVDAVLANTFTVMDTSEDQVFLYIENHGLHSPFGNVYISGDDGHSFSLSIENVIKGQAVDFERVASLDGTYIVNQYSAGKQQSVGRQQDAIIEFDESDIIVEEQKKSRIGRAQNGNENKKQMVGQRPIEESIPARDVQQSVKTYITHNKGASWEALQAPTKTSKGKNIKCYTDEGCSLQLELYSHQGELAPVYSTKTSVGIVLGTGNLGKRLTANDEPKNLYISRDGGLNWRSVKPGVFIYEIGDHGSIIVIAQKNKPVKEIEFSWDEGLTWEKVQISEQALFVRNIIIEPNSKSQEFLVYGSYATDSDATPDDEQAEPSERAFITYLDFTSLHMRQCEIGDWWAPNSDNSDFESWTPYDGRHGSNKCFMGQTATYSRRKQDSRCYNGEDYEQLINRMPCQCTEMDYECDFGYTRAENKEGNLKCEKQIMYPKDAKAQKQFEDSIFAKRKQEQCDEYGYYEVSQGYRRIPGNICISGLKLDPTTVHCSTAGWLGSLFTMKGLFIMSVLGAVCYFGWPIIEAFLLAIIMVCPIPDPSQFNAWTMAVLEFLQNLPSKLSGSSAQDSNGKKEEASGQYGQDFEMAPGSLMDEEDDEEDIGLADLKDNSASSGSLNFEDEGTTKEGASETADLIQLDDNVSGGAKKRKNVPKLKGPKK